MLQEFLRTGTDGWELALASVRDLFAEADLHADEVGGDFAGEAERLGVATAEVHAVLAEQFPTEQRGAEPTWPRWPTRCRPGSTTRWPSCPRCEPYADALRAAYDGVAALAAAARSTVQRVHGDLHLGQTLRTAAGWKIVDFEGEPAKPLAERPLPDPPWRDVAGMLRSFDYAAAPVVAAPRPTRTRGRRPARLPRRAEWAERNTQRVPARLRRRRPASTRASEQVLLRAYVADKAVYEAVYEARNRPTWVPIPLGRDRAASASLSDDRTTDLPDPPSRRRRELDQLVRGEHGDPHAVLGAAPPRGRRSRSARCGRWPPSVTVAVATGGHAATRWSTSTTASGSACSPLARGPDYRLEVDLRRARRCVADDPYRFLPTLGEVDLHLINEGRHEQLWQVLGAHVHALPRRAAARSPAPRSRCGRRTRQGVRVNGDFNYWDGREHPMRQLGVLRRLGAVRARRRRRAPATSSRCSAPTACGARRPTRWPPATEAPPATASVVYRVDLHLGRRGLDARRAASGPHAAADVDLRGAPRLVAPRARPAEQLADELVGVRRGDRASPTSSCCR